MCLTHLRRVPADDATITGWVSSILLLPPIFNLLLTTDEGRLATLPSNTPPQDRNPLAESALLCVPLTKLFLR